MAWLVPDDRLFGSRVRLRPPHWHDISFIRHLWSDPATMAAVGGPCELSDDRARDWYARMVGPGSRQHCYCLIFNETSRPVGEVSFHRLDADMQATLNIKVLASERSKGYGRDALLVFLDFFFHRVGGHVMADDVALDNMAGQQLLLRFGFEQVPSPADNTCLLRMTKERFNSLYTS